jgi:hypothetical protein
MENFWESKENQTYYEFIELIGDVVLGNKDYELDATPAGIKEYGTFCGAHLNTDDVQFHTSGFDLYVTRNGETKEIPNYGEVLSWLVGMAIFLKQRNLLEDFQKFYMFR